MAAEPYFIRLANRLTNGLAQMAAERRQRHRGFILSQQMSDGGFRGRDGNSDLYYTGFAVRGLASLGELSPRQCQRVGRYLNGHTLDRLSIIDLVSWLSTGLLVQVFGGDDPFAHTADDWAERIADKLESVRTADGGYAKTVEGASGSTYHSLLVMLGYELIGRSVPNPNALIRFLYDRQRDDGGFVEIAPMKRGGTNPTAAAVALLAKFDAIDNETREHLREFLKEIRSGEGGFQANTRIPFADGLSTFTGLLTAEELGFDDILDSAKLEEFIANCLELPTGGFRGASFDEAADVEYTFYGLGVLGLLWSVGRRGERQV